MSIDVAKKIKDLKEEILNKGAEEKAAKARIAELKNLIEEKKRREESLKQILEEEAALIKELGLE